MKTKYKDQIETLIISDVRIGVLLSAALLSDSSYGVSSTVTDTLVNCDKKSRDYGDFSPLKIKGEKVISLFETEKKSSLIDTLKTVVLNAISSNNHILLVVREIFVEKIIQKWNLKEVSVLNISDLDYLKVSKLIIENIK